MKLWAAYPWISFYGGSLEHFRVPENLVQALLKQLYEPVPTTRLPWKEGMGRGEALDGKSMTPPSLPQEGIVCTFRKHGLSELGSVRWENPG